MSYLKRREKGRGSVDGAKAQLQERIGIRKKKKKKQGAGPKRAGLMHPGHQDSDRKRTILEGDRGRRKKQFKKKGLVVTECRKVISGLGSVQPVGTEGKRTKNALNKEVQTGGHQANGRGIRKKARSRLRNPTSPGEKKGAGPKKKRKDQD